MYCKSGCDKTCPAPPLAIANECMLLIKMSVKFI